MRCQICKKEKAVIHIEQIIGNKKVDLHLCDGCAREHGINTVDNKIEVSIPDLLIGLVARGKQSGPMPAKCTHCGKSWQEIKKEQKVGCSECYALFNRPIRSFLSKNRQNSDHQGKYPRRLLPYKIFLVDVPKLKEELKEALKCEDYETAASLRDRIRKLEFFPRGDNG